MIGWIDDNGGDETRASGLVSAAHIRGEVRMTDPEMIRLHFAQIMVAKGHYSATCGDCHEDLEGKAEGDWTVALVAHAASCTAMDADRG